MRIIWLIPIVSCIGLLIRVLMPEQEISPDAITPIGCFRVVDENGHMKYMTLYKDELTFDFEKEVWYARKSGYQSRWNIVPLMEYELPPLD